jgi:hypothetical protein
MTIHSIVLALIAISLTACATTTEHQPERHSAVQSNCQKIPELTVATHSADPSLLLPTRSNKPRLSKTESADYFHHFLANKPIAKIDMRFIDLGNRWNGTQ